MTKDMTAGKPLGLILRFCGPMVFGNILQQLYSMVDTVIVGRYLGASALAGVGATGAISFLVDLPPASARDFPFLWRRRSAQATITVCGRTSPTPTIWERSSAFC
mgnify:CR=1 FL=1